MKLTERIGKIGIACFMAISLFQLPVRAAAQNLALEKPITASSFEVASTDASKAVDGDMNTRWGTAQNLAANEWLEVDLGSLQDIKQINIHFERSDAAQNILGYKVELYNGTGYETVYTKNEKAKQKEVVILKEAKQANKVRITILNADGGTINWINVGINELEVYNTILDDDQSDERNVITGALMSASSVEENLERLNADKVKDGSLDTRWASNYDAPNTQWIKAAFTDVKKIKQINLHFLNRDVAPYDSNVEKFSIKYTDKNGEEQVALQDYANTSLGTGKGWQTEVTILLDEAIYAKDLTICEFEANSKAYNNISITELEAYASQQDSKVDLDSVVASITGQEIDKNTNQLPMPKVPNGYRITLHGADFEQLIADDGTLVHPLTYKQVQLSFEVVETATNETKITEDITYVMQGVHEPIEATNSKPVIIPEIAEWYAVDANQLPMTSIKKVVYDDASLQSIVEEFIQDYEDFTGSKLQQEKRSDAVANAFNFMKKAPDALLGEEGYTMDIQNDRITAESEAVTGTMYAMQTILQMVKQYGDHFPQGTMRDYPRFETRGFLLDVARKPISMDMLQDIAKTMRYYKMNDFQIHLSDNYIFLEDYGYGEQEQEAFKAYDAFRLESSLQNDKGESPTAQDYHYTKAEFQHFIQQQRSMGMKIVPEIDVPAHANSFTKIWPELMVSKKTSPMNSKRPLIDHLDVSKPETMAKIEEVFDDYTKGDDPVFDAETTVHIGADEFLDNYTAYRNFVNELTPYVKQTNKVRMWGGLTWIDDYKTQIKPEAIQDVEMNLWSSDWADGLQMYEMGYDLINTIDDYGYMVPDGSKGRANAYGDMLNITRIFDSFAPNRLKTRSGYKMIPSGDEQMLGAAFAIWSDNIDKRASGLSDSDYYWRFFDAMPFYAEKTWAATGKEKGSAAALSELAVQQGSGPNTNPYYMEEKNGDVYEAYDFADGLKDTSSNHRDLQAGNAKVEKEALVLSGGNSHVTSPIQKLGNGNELSFDITLKAPSQPGQILFESDAAYGTHDIRIMADGKLGFTRELYEYSFDYVLPVEKSVNVAIVTSQQKTKLYIDGEFVSDAEGKFIHQDIVKKTGITNATFALPLQRIGSKTNAIKAVMDNIMVSVSDEQSVDTYHKDAWTATTNSETKYNETEGLVKYAFDNNPATIWHSNWQGASDKLTGTNSFYAEIDFHQTFAINQFSFTPRSPQASGQVTKADLFVKEHAEDEWKQVATDQVFAADSTKKTFVFAEQNVRFVKFVAKESNDGWVAVSEFDIANKPAPTLQVYVTAQGSGTVSGATEVSKGTEVTVTANPDQGSVFDGWYFNGAKVSSDAAYTFVVNDNTALIAKFMKEAYIVSIDGITQLVKVGEKAEVTIPVKAGHHFDGFYEAGATEPFNFDEVIQRDVTVISQFTPYKVTVMQAMHGTAASSEMNERGEVTLTAAPDAGYHFVEWVSDGQVVATDNVYTLIPEKDQTFTPVFAVNDQDNVNKTILSYLVETAKKVKKEDYVQNDDWKAFEAALAQAEALLLDETADQSAVDRAAAKLSNAYTEIRLVPREEMLKQLEDFLHKIKNINRSFYSKKDLAVMDAVAKEAEDMLAGKVFNEEAFQLFEQKMAVVNGMIKHNMQQPDQNKPDGDKQTNVVQDPKPTEKKVPKTADSTNAAGFLLMSAVAGFWLVISTKKRKKQ